MCNSRQSTPLALLLWTPCRRIKEFLTWRSHVLFTQLLILGRERWYRFTIR
ncbi:hypothetical protein KC19_VG223600 [Ceratodon purpureus]|uniref:Uncharacterized protein n=1 Tax=Ceratodon purpureus TaxID=3225 RepID=A0A8T0HTV4_CERPU|nr:hypothetical protein KC19_VG223600 [Ceratodon purpureus]